ncbi:MAG: DUF6513 domain-containing protein [Pirellulaceae bacterium]
MHFVTGRFAEAALRREVEKLAQQLGFEFSVQVLPITVAALLSPPWIAARLNIPPGTTLLMLPGYASGDLKPIHDVAPTLKVVHGPKDLRDLNRFMTGRHVAPDLKNFDIEILAEINSAPSLPIDEIERLAVAYQNDGADVIDIGCLPGASWSGVGDCVKRLVDLGLRISIDSLDPEEIGLATRAGAELVLSVNSSNLAYAIDWGREVVVIPDTPNDWDSLDRSIAHLKQNKIPFRIDPILEPIGFDFGKSLLRYAKVRERWPDQKMMMGVGNLSEMTEVDSAGINMLLISLCQEWRIESVLTTQVINWGRSSVRECDIARRLAKYSIDNGVPPKHLTEWLVCLRDGKVPNFGEEILQAMSSQIRDRNYRIIAESNEMHVMGLEDWFRGDDPFEIVDEMLKKHPRNVDPSHAFYLGYELCKAELALALGKRYVQDEPLNWGFLTPQWKPRHRLKTRNQRIPPSQ